MKSVLIDGVEDLAVKKDLEVLKLGLEKRILQSQIWTLGMMLTGFLAIAGLIVTRT